jgi:serine/threonine protein kinase
LLSFKALVDRQSQLGVPFPPPQLLDLLLSVGQALSQIHSIGVIHADIASRNILLWRQTDGQLVGHLTDFGLSTRAYTSVDAGKPKPWRTTCPEAWLNPVSVRLLTHRQAQWTKKADVFSFGCLIWELISFQRPFPHVLQPPITDMRAMLADIASAHPTPPAADGRLVGLMQVPIPCLSTKACWRFEHTERISLTEIVDTLSDMQPKLSLDTLAYV